ncbi:hypothetical protein [Aquibium oceanicum]|uniref:Uncharacterized protein n=1 Tax=Aquibium oceanicum TaxID=1670800 RepID=A0A1L3ST50_9HYPH|nr:hypothetical protein [Aquibium oceanicum]APH72568.1 hypothetical protein BSQ44_15290 [Aquibium oceanicum]
MHGAEREGRRLRQVVTLLVSLAVLAERAGRRSFPVRWFVLVLLRHAEVVARDFVVETTGAAPLCPEAPLGTRPADAALLAGRLRMLAALLRAVLPPDGRMDPRLISARDPRRVAIEPIAAACGGLIHPAFDTS